MKISPKTLEVLQNFSTINRSLLFLQGKQQRTVATTDTVYAEFEAEEDFPKEFAIYDLPKFLGILSLFNDPDLTFNEDSISIEEGVQKIVYKYCNPELIKYPPKGKNINVGNTELKITLSKDILKTALKATSIFNHGHLAFEGNGTELTLRTINVEEKENDGAYYVLGTTDKKFSNVVSVDNLPLLMTDYDVTITDKLYAQFESTETKVKYICACDKKHSAKG